MYILIFESGEIKKASSICDDDLVSVNDGVLDIINISNSSDPRYCDPRYCDPSYDNIWRPLENVYE